MRNRPAETPLAIGALIAYFRLPLAAFALLLCAAACAGCALLAYSVGARAICR